MKMKQNIYDDNKETKTTQLHVICGRDHHHAQTNYYSSYGSELLTVAGSRMQPVKLHISLHQIINIFFLTNHK